MKRGSTSWDNLKYIQTCKAKRQGMMDDLLAFDKKQVLKAIEKNKSLKHARCKQCLGKKNLISIMEEDGTQIHNRDHIVTCCVEFYLELYRYRRLPMDTMEPHSPVMDDALPVILPTEVEASIKKLDYSKAPGEDNITGGVLWDSGQAIGNLPTWLFNKCLQLCQVQKAWQNMVMVLLHKKGNSSDIKNYRPISLLPIIYKVFSHILLQQILSTLEPWEWPGFRSDFSMADHLYVINQF